MADKPRDHCGVFGLCASGQDAARLVFFGLLALQHRGQESAGIASCRDGRIAAHRGMGLVSQIFRESTLRKLRGNPVIGHVRYSTEGSSELRNAQPTVLASQVGDFALAHNGHLANFQTLRSKLLKRGHGLSSAVDSEVIARVILASPGRTLSQKIVSGVSQIRGAFSLVILFQNQLFAVRDPWGIRPLVIGKINGDNWIAASESTAINSLGGQVVREVKPGEILSISAKGPKTIHQAKVRGSGFCIFEYVYFARPDSVLNGKLVHAVRNRAGQFLAKESPVEADLVISVPDSGTSAALGFSAQSGIPFQEGLIKSRYIGRTFIEPSQRLRDLGVKLKFAPLEGVLKGRRVVVIDDSIVRGTTLKQLSAMLRQAGAREVHLRIASPPFKNICYLGVNVSQHCEIIASDHSVGEIRQALEVDSLAYLSLPGLKRAVGRITWGLCTGCFNGKYPVTQD